MFSALLAILCMVLGTATNAQQSADMTTLFAQLGDPTTTDRAFHQILEASRKDPAERASAMRRLPSIIEKNQGNRPWVNSVTLTGKLKAENAIPALIEVLPRSSDTPSIIVGFADSSTLRNDTVGKALCEIGDPTVPALADILKSSDSNGGSKKESNSRHSWLPRLRQATATGCWPCTWRVPHLSGSGVFAAFRF
jgi:hypothetical protein